MPLQSDIRITLKEQKLLGSLYFHKPLNQNLLEHESVLRKYLRQWVDAFYGGTDIGFVISYLSGNVDLLIEWRNEQSNLEEALKEIWCGGFLQVKYRKESLATCKNAYAIMHKHFTLAIARHIQRTAKPLPILPEPVTVLDIDAAIDIDKHRQELSLFQLEILRYMLEGYGSREIAKRFVVKRHRIRKEIENICLLLSQK